MREITRAVTLAWHGPRPVLVPAALHHLPPSPHRQNQDEVEAVLGSLFVEDSVRINADINWRESASSSSTNKWSNTCPSISFQQTCGRKSTTTTSTVTKAKSLTRTISWVNSTTHWKRYAVISVETPHWHWFLPPGLLLESPLDGCFFLVLFLEERNHKHFSYKTGFGQVSCDSHCCWVGFSNLWNMNEIVENEEQIFF